jgi:DNA-binding CsgD family transcriptional regulator
MTALAHTSPRIWERDGVTEAMSRALDRAADGSGESLYIIGQAGLGKSSLLTVARRLAGSEFLVGTEVGDQSEATEPFGLVGSAIEGIGGPVPPAAPRGSISPDERASYFHKTLRWLESLDRPTALLLDDCHWADAGSLDLLVFLCRRAATMPLAVIATLRPWPPMAKQAFVGVVRGGHGSCQWLAPLGDGGARALVASRAGRPVPQPVAAEAARDCAGNPLLLDQLARSIGEGSGRAGTLTVISDNGDGTLARDRFAGVDDAALHLLEGASVFGDRFRPKLAAEVAGLDEIQAERSFEAIWAAGLALDVGDGQAELTHPLFRQALYDGIAPPVRTQLHARAFRALARRGLYESEIAVHARRGQLFGDRQAIALFERLGRSALSSGAASTAVEHLQAAVALAAGNADVSLRLALAEALVIVGEPLEAIEVLEDVMADPVLGETHQSEALRMIGWAHFNMGAHARAEASFREAAAVGDDGDPELAVETLLDRAIACWDTDGPLRALELTVRARQLASGVGDDLRSRVEAAWGFAALRAGDASGLPAIENGARLVELEPVSASTPRRWSDFVMGSFAAAATWTERFPDAERALDIALGRAERVGAVGTRAALGVTLSDTLTRQGRLREAYISAGGEEGAGVGPTPAPFTLARRAFILLQLGRLDEAESCCAEAEPAAKAANERTTLMWLWHTRGARCLGEGDIEGACELYAGIEELARSIGIGEPCVVPWGRNAVISCALAGRFRDARRVIRWLERSVVELPCRWPRIAAATGRAALLTRTGHIEEADGQYRAALALHEGLTMPIERTRTLLDYGSFLRHHGQPARARPMLAEAVESAEALDAGWLAEGARGELGAAGGRRRRPVAGRRALTPSEDRVARLAAGGASNEAMAKQLSISVRTVETHLQHAYAKLGIRSRRQLMARSYPTSGGSQGPPRSPRRRASSA